MFVFKYYYNNYIYFCFFGYHIYMSCKLVFLLFKKPYAQINEVNIFRIRFFKQSFKI